jgi:hypothetical protein
MARCAGCLSSLIVAVVAVAILRFLPFSENVVINMALIIASAVGLSIGVFTQYVLNQGRENEHATFLSLVNPESWLSSIPFPDAFARVQHQITTSHVGTNWWVLREVNPDTGYVMAVLRFSGHPHPLAMNDAFRHLLP